MSFANRNDHSHDFVPPGEGREFHFSAVSDETYVGVIPHASVLSRRRAGSHDSVHDWAKHFVRDEAVGSLFHINRVPHEPEGRPWNGKTPAAHRLPGA